MSFLIITGISGSGKTQVSNALEDLGYFCIDNLPPQMLLPVFKLAHDNPATHDICVVVDARSQNMFETFQDELVKMKKDKIDCKLVYITGDQDVILERYKQTRRNHPLMVTNPTLSLTEAIRMDFEICKPIREMSDYVIDTTHLSIQQLKKLIIDTFKQTDYSGMTIKLISFGYRNGLPADADLVLDVRCTPNPFYVAELKNHSGLDQDVYDYVFSYPQSQQLADKFENLLEYALPYYVEEGKLELDVAIGCTSGHHRSVAFVRHIAARLQHTDYNIVVIHRDLQQPY